MRVSLAPTAADRGDGSPKAERATSTGRHEALADWNTPLVRQEADFWCRCGARCASVAQRRASGDRRHHPRAHEAGTSARRSRRFAGGTEPTRGDAVRALVVLDSCRDARCHRAVVRRTDPGLPHATSDEHALPAPMDARRGCARGVHRRRHRVSPAGLVPNGARCGCGGARSASRTGAQATRILIRNQFERTYTDADGPGTCGANSACRPRPIAARAACADGCSEDSRWGGAAGVGAASGSAAPPCASAPRTPVRAAVSRCAAAPSRPGRADGPPLRADAARGCSRRSHRCDGLL